MAKVRETHVETDAEGRIVTSHDRDVERSRRAGGFGWGVLFGVVLLAAVIMIFVYTQGSFQQAGLEADQASAHMQAPSGEAIKSIGAVLEDSGDRAQQASNQLGDTVTN